MKKIFFSITLALILSALHSANAQQQPLKDTSFTTYSAYKGALKKYPFITIAKPPVPAGIVSKYNIVYCSINGRDLHLDVFYPSKTTKPLPSVLFIHGGGWRTGDRSQHVPLAQQVAAKGYVAITVEYRLSTEALYPAAVNDLKTAIKWMRVDADRYPIDKSKLAVWGFSAGGQLAALLGASGNSPVFKGDDCFAGVPDDVQGVIDADGILAFIHPESGEGDDSKSKSAASSWFGFSKTERADLWQQASALNYVGKKTPPFLFLNSAVDRMHAGRNDMVSRLDSLHIYSEVHTFPNTPHPFLLFNPWFEPVLNYTIAFLDKLFKPNG